MDEPSHIRSALRRIGGLHAIAAWVVLAVLLTVFFTLHPRGLTLGTATIWANSVFVLATIAAGQAIVVMTRNLDLSVGSILALTNCAAALLVNGGTVQTGIGVIAVLVIGALCGLVNGLIVVHGRIQSIIATLATGAIFFGIALAIMPVPGGNVNEGLSEFATYDLWGVVPAALFLLAAAIILIWGPVRGGLLGRAILATGSNQTAAFMSGLPVRRAQIGAYVLCGVFSALGGLFLALQTMGGDANAGLPYTLNSIAAVVIGGVALSGGAGTVWGAAAGAMIIRTIGALLFFTGIAPLAQPLIQGLVLMAAVGAGALIALRTDNRLELLK